MNQVWIEHGAGGIQEYEVGCDASTNYSFRTDQSGWLAFANTMDALRTYSKVIKLMLVVAEYGIIKVIPLAQDAH